jgi:hypothetical protein
LIVDNVFSRNTARVGGVLYITTQGDKPISSIYIVKRNKFENNSAMRAGAIYTNNVNINITENTFDRNTAFDNYTNDETIAQTSKGNAGACLLDCKDITNCNLTLANNVFVGNNGGAIQWKDKMPYGLKTNNFTNNTAKYAPDCASFAVDIAVVNADGSIQRKLQDGLSAFQGVASGQSGQIILRMAPIDHNGVVIATD